MILAIIVLAVVLTLPIIGLIFYACYRGVREEWEEYGWGMFKCW